MLLTVSTCQCACANGVTDKLMWVSISIQAEDDNDPWPYEFTSIEVTKNYFITYMTTTGKCYYYYYKQYTKSIKHI